MRCGRCPTTSSTTARPDRDRPMREFGYHIFRMIQRTIQGVETGVFALEDAATIDRPWSLV